MCLHSLEVKGENDTTLLKPLKICYIVANGEHTQPETPLNNQQSSINRQPFESFHFYHYPIYGLSFRYLLLRGRSCFALTETTGKISNKSWNWIHWQGILLF